MILDSQLSRDLLIDAYKFYSRQDARAHDAIKIILDRNDMEGAVVGCIDDALKEDEPTKQNLYIQAAWFGKTCHPGIAIDQFPSACRKLRFLNYCRIVGIDPNLPEQVQIDDLIARGQFKEAIWAVNLLQTAGEAKIREKWCESVITESGLKDTEIAQKIQNILGSRPAISYADVAAKSIKLNKTKLAIKLLESERQSSRQIPLLLSLKQYDLVLVRALSTCDSNLIYTSLMQLKDAIPSDMLFNDLLMKHQSAFRYYCNFLAVSDLPRLLSIPHTESQDEELSLYLADNRLDRVHLYCKDHKLEFVAHQIHLDLKLAKYQDSLKHLPLPPSSKRQTWLSLSVCETITNLVAIGQTTRARDCQKRFEISEKKFRVLEQIGINILPDLTTDNTL